jgi:hypothetical protein
LEELSKKKSSGIEPATFRLVAQCRFEGPITGFFWLTIFHGSLIITAVNYANLRYLTATYLKIMQLPVLPMTWNDLRK